MANLCKMFKDVLRLSFMDCVQLHILGLSFNGKRKVPL
jgi:hypothetical protein